MSRKAIGRDVQEKFLDRAVARILSALSCGSMSERFLFECAGCSSDLYVEAKMF